MSQKIPEVSEKEIRRFIGEVRDVRVAALIERTILQTGGGLDEEWSREALATIEHLKARAKDASAEDALAELVASAWYPLSWLFNVLMSQARAYQFGGFIEAACAAWWDSMTEAQLRLGCSAQHAHRGLAAYLLTQLYLAQKDRGSALRWAALGHLADAISGTKSGGGNDISFRFGLGVPEETLSLLRALASEDASATPAVERLPEWLLVRALNDPHGLPLLGASPRYTHHPSRAFVSAAAVHAFDDLAVTSEQKGKRLEWLVAFLFSTVPGMRPRLRLVSDGQAAETDLVGTLVGESPYPLPERTLVWLAECKNWNVPASAKEITAFFGKMRLTKTDFGIFVARSGVTGAGRDANAERLNRELAKQDSHVCLIVADDEIRALGNAGNFRTFVDARYERWRFGQ